MSLSQSLLQCVQLTQRFLFLSLYLRGGLFTFESAFGFLHQLGFHEMSETMF